MRTIVTDDNFSYLGKRMVKKNSSLKGGALRLKEFDDGWPNLFFKDVDDIIRNSDVTFIGDFSKPENLFQNISIIEGIIDNYANKVRVILPYFPVGTMERVDKNGEIATAKTFAKIMSNLSSGREGKTSIHIFDIHALVERYLFDNDKVNVEMHTALNLLKDEIEIEGKVPVFPDEGAAKRFGKEFKGDKIICDKIRDGDIRKVTIKEGNPKGKDTIIIDDLVQTGGTIIETADVLRNAGAASVDSYSTHGVNPNNSHIKLAEKVDKLIVTDSIPANINRAKDISNMEVLSIEPLIQDIMFRDAR